MRTTTVDRDGTVRCPGCGGTSFAMKRTAGAKLGLGLTVGLGALAAPKRTHCLGCGEDLRSGGKVSYEDQPTVADLESQVEADKGVEMNFRKWRRARDAADLAAGRKRLGTMAASGAHSAEIHAQIKRKQDLKQARRDAR